MTLALLYDVHGNLPALEAVLDRDPRAAYALLHDDGQVERRRVGYPHSEAAAALRARFAGDWTELVARRIEHARFDPDAV